MTDSNATELLRKMLDERGVEWADQFGPFPVTAYEGNGVTWIAKEYTAGKFSIETRPVTPEQAVAATLGADDGSRWFELFGTPERAAETLAKQCFDSDYEACHYCINADCDEKLRRAGSFPFVKGELLDWLRGKAVKR